MPPRTVSGSFNDLTLLPGTSRNLLHTKCKLCAGLICRKDDLKAKTVMCVPVNQSAQNIQHLFAGYITTIMTGYHA